MSKLNEIMFFGKMIRKPKFYLEEFRDEEKNRNNDFFY